MKQTCRSTAAKSSHRNTKDVCSNLHLTLFCKLLILQRPLQFCILALHLLTCRWCFTTISACQWSLQELLAPNLDQLILFFFVHGRPAIALLVFSPLKQCLQAKQSFWRVSKSSLVKSICLRLAASGLRKRRIATGQA